MTEFQAYDASTHPEVKLIDDYNNIVDHAFEKPANIIIRLKDGVYEAIYGDDSEQAGMIGSSNASLATVLAWARDTGLTGGRTWKEKILLKGNVTLDAEFSLGSYTILEIQGKVLRPADSTHHMFVVDGKSDVEIIGGIIDGNKDNFTVFDDTTYKDLIRIVDSNYVTVAYVKLQNHIYESIEVCGTSSYTGIFNCQFVNQRCCGIWFLEGDGNRPQYGRIIGNTFYYSYNTENVAIYESDFITIVGNTFSYSNRAGVVMQDSKYFTIANNTFYENGRELDAVFGTSNQPAIYVHTNCEDGTIVGNAITKCYQGVYISSSKKIIVADNVVALLYGTAIYLTNTEAVTIIGNQITDNSQDQNIIHSGINIVKGTNGNKYLIIKGNLIGNILAGAKQQRFGIYEVEIDALDTDCVIEGNIIVKAGGLGTHYIFAGAAVTFRNNLGLAKTTNPYDNTNDQISKLASGLNASPTSAKEYTIAHSDVFITTTGGTVSDITIKDQDGNTRETGITSLAVPRYLPVGWTIKWTFTVAPTIIISGHF